MIRTTLRTNLVGFARRSVLNYKKPTFQPLVQQRTLRLSPSQFQAVKGWGFIINILGGAYIGGFIVCMGLLYLLYHDADERQNIPFELSFQNQLTAVKAINKDDVLKSPRHAVKHYRRLLIELAKQENPNLDFDETTPENKYRAPLLESETLLYKKSQKFSDFYIDIVSRYAKALLAKGQLDISIETLEKLVYDDEVFYKLGDSERLSNCARLLCKISDDFQTRQKLLDRSIDMITKSFPSVRINDYMVESSSNMTDELFSCLNETAFNFAKESSHKKELLNKSLNIYLNNLKFLNTIKSEMEANTINQNNYPFFNISSENVSILINEVRGHLSEIMWTKGYKKNAVSWGEEVVDDIYHSNASSQKTTDILIGVLDNLIFMHHKMGNLKGEKRCKELRGDLKPFDEYEKSYYNNVINKFSKIIYQKGPLGIIEKVLTERFGPTKRLLDIEEFEEEDVE